MILVLLEQVEGQIKKSSLEALCFASELASQINLVVKAVVPDGVSDKAVLGTYGADEVLTFHTSNELDSIQWAELIIQLNQKLNPQYIVLSNNSLGKAIGGYLSVKLNRGLVSNVIQLKTDQGKPIFKKSVFSGKAYAWYRFKEDAGIISVMAHGYGIYKNKNKQPSLGSVDVSINASNIKLKERKLIKGKTPLTESDIVVSAGRGLKDTSNWPMIEELAELLNAATACSRPVADAGWRPHHEHVGQTGIAIRPNVYIAIGISGAIQHLAGVNNSKTIVVINKDPEAPFFKAADYGICGDLFEIVPKLNEAIRKAK